MTQSTPELSVVIPAYNEATSLSQTIGAIARFLAESKVSHEILVADDGSTDRTVDVITVLQESIPGVRMLHAEHRGKGAAVRLGVLEACGRTVLFLDADHSTRIEEWRKFAPWLAEGYDVVIGSRKISGAQVRRHQPFLRETMGKVFTWLTNTLLGAHLTDITCGFKGFRREAARRIFSLQRIDGWGFDAEILFIARRGGYRIKEVPVVWTDDATTKVHLLKDAVRSLRELIQIRVGSWLGWYGHAAPPARFLETELEARELTE